MSIVQQLAKMQSNIEQQHENKRKHVWTMAWCAVASAWNAESSAVATKWADAALKEFDQRFPKPQVDFNKLLASDK